MAKGKKRGIFSLAVILVLAAVLCIALNPGEADFKGFLSSKSSKGTKTTLGENALSDLASGLAGGLGSVAASAYKRSNALFFSTYTIKVNEEVKSQYLGLLKIFMKLK